MSWRAAIATTRSAPVSVSVMAAWWTLNGNGEMTGVHWLAESGILSGAVITETIFSWPGMGYMFTQALEQLGRSGVPVYVLYQNGRAPVVFSEILQMQALRAALAQL